MKLTIKITKEVLEKTKMCGKSSGLELIAENCAIAYAIRRLFPKATVGPWNLFFDLATKTPLPLVAQSFIETFDYSSIEERLLLPEFSFDIEVPDSVIESIGIEQAKEIISKSSTLELIES